MSSSRRSSRRRQRAQSLVEFAITLPVLMLLLLVASDFGRVFLGWVNLNNAARVAANYAAQNPTAWGTPGDAAALAEYQREISAETGGINCTMPSPAPAPTFASGTDVGDPATVSLSCDFTLLTPFLSQLMGGPIHLTATSVFPIRGGVIEGVPVGSVVPTPTPTAAASSSATPTPTPTATPEPMCTVPTLVGQRTNNAAQIWGTGPHGAGFTTPIIFSPQVPPAYTIGSQSVSPGQSLPCDTTVITVTP